MQKIRQKSNKQNKKEVPKKILDKEKNQVKNLKIARYLDTKDQDKTNSIICLYLQKLREKKQYSCRCWAFFNRHMHEIFLQRYCMKWVPWDPLKEMIN